MKVVQINTLCGSGSTGNICLAISKMLTKQGIENYIFYNAGHSDYQHARLYMRPIERKIAAVKTRIIGNFGFNACLATKRLIKELEDICPDIVHLHNLHGHNIHMGVLFSYLKEKQVKIFWTFHDCWAFTGYCPHYDMIGCDRWKTGGCHDCPQKRKTSWFFDRSKYLYERKRELLTGLDMTIITPSQWLADQVKCSFLREYDVKVINNGIDLSVFYPRDNDFRRKHHLEKKFIVLGVAHIWCRQKGLDIFIELSNRLDDRFQIVLVGTNDKVDKQLPDNIISIHRTQNQAELAEIYTAADLFVNPTREENYPTTHMESLACGTPVLTFRTGGSPEMLNDYCGAVVDKNDTDALLREILRIYEQKPFQKEACLARAKAFNQDWRFEEYVKLYEDEDSISD